MPGSIATSTDTMSEESTQSNAPFMITEARDFFRETRPPFVVTGEIKSENVTRTVIIAVNGGFPTGRQEYIDLIYHAWDDRAGFWTMEQGGKKLIVKAFRGAPKGGCTFRPWMGPENGFDNPVAFSITRRIKDNSSFSEKDDEESSQRRDSRATIRTTKTEAAERITNSFMSPVSDVELYAVDDRVQSKAVRAEPERKNHITPTSSSNQDHIASHKSVKKRFSIKPAIEPSPPSGCLKRRNLSSRPNADGKKMRRNNSLKAQPDEPKLATVAETLKASLPEFLSLSFIGLSAHQLLNTILHVSLPPRPDFVPIRLRSCNTMDNFFTSISKAFDIQKHEHNLKTVRVTFDWMSKNDKNRSWLVKKNVDDSFEIFLECVSTANIWADGGTAIVHVEILTKGWV